MQKAVNSVTSVVGGSRKAIWPRKKRHQGRSCCSENESQYAHDRESDTSSGAEENKLRCDSTQRAHQKESRCDDENAKNAANHTKYWTQQAIPAQIFEYSEHPSKRSTFPKRLNIGHAFHWLRFIQQLNELPFQVGAKLSHVLHPFAVIVNGKSAIETTFGHSPTRLKTVPRSFHPRTKPDVPPLAGRRLDLAGPEQSGNFPRVANQERLSHELQTQLVQKTFPCLWLRRRQKEEGKEKGVVFNDLNGWRVFIFFPESL